MVVLEEEKISGLLSGWGLTTRTCDNCTSCSALLYCGSHSAFLCGACDSTLHRQSHHERVWICEVCEQAPASVTCKADAAALCSSCDRDIHSANPLAARHQRVPITPFFDTPSSPSGGLVKETATTVDTWLIPNPDFLNYNNNYQDLANNYGNNNEINYDSNNSINYINQAFPISDSVVPSHSNGNLTSLQYNSFDIDFSQPNKQFQVMSSSNFAPQQPSVSVSDIAVPDGNTKTTSEVSYTFTKSVTNGGSGDVASSGTTGAVTGPVLDREARVLRYREKRKNRKFEKTIRYASRKAYAETRPRIKGRFAKRTERSDSDTSEFDPIYLTGSGGFVLEQGGYSVVPSF